MVCASPAYLQRCGTPQCPEDLADHQCLGFTHWSRRGGWMLGRTTTPQRGWPVSRFQSNNGLALRMAALEGFGIVMQSSAMLGGDVAAGRLVALLHEHLPPPQPMHIVYPKDRQPVPKLTRFVEFLVAQLAA